MTLHLILLNSMFRTQGLKDSVSLILNLLILSNMETITFLHHQMPSDFHSLCQDHLLIFVNSLKLYSGALLINSTYSYCIFKATHFLSPL